MPKTLHFLARHFLISQIPHCALSLVSIFHYAFPMLLIICSFPISLNSPAATALLLLCYFHHSLYSHSFLKMLAASITFAATRSMLIESRNLQVLHSAELAAAIDTGKISLYDDVSLPWCVNMKISEVL